MYEIAATVTTAAPTELKLTGNWPVDWLQAPGIRSIEIQRKLLANEFLGSPFVAVREEEILGNRANWPNLQLGDRVIVRCPELGYSIQIVPHTSADRPKIKREARERHQPLRDYCQGEILSSMALGEFE